MILLCKDSSSSVFATLRRDKQERKEAEEELRINRERLKTASSILQHDITNDLTVIKSAVDIYSEEQD